jgi:hypothetical protein
VLAPEVVIRLPKFKASFVAVAHGLRETRVHPPVDMARCIAAACIDTGRPAPCPQVSSQLSLKPVLEKLGVAAAFSDSAADFSRMAAHSLYVTDVVHKVRLKGGKAASVST